MIPFAERCQVEPLEFNDMGHVKLKMPFRGNENHVGTMYAGSLFTLAEFSGLPLCLSAFGMNLFDTHLPVVANYFIKFLKPVKKDMFVTIDVPLHEIENVRGKMLMEGKKPKMILEKKLVDDEGTVYAETKGVYVFIPNPDPEKSNTFQIM